MNFLLALFFLLPLAKLNCGQSWEDDVNWCDVQNKYCPRGISHIACAEDSFPFGECEDLEIINMSAKMKKNLLLRHNYYRNHVAGGFLDGKPPASRMMQMHWDDELEFLARKHVEHCNFAHDGCRATNAFQAVGQNIALFQTSLDTGEAAEYIVAAVDLWYAEHLDAKVNVPVDPDAETGHFLTMMLDGNHRMGCSMAIYRALKDNVIKNTILLTCNYSAALTKGEDTYKVGISGTECKTFGCQSSEIFDSLCDEYNEANEGDPEDPEDQEFLYNENLLYDQSE